jgi:hypothetical protein
MASSTMPPPWLAISAVLADFEFFAAACSSRCRLAASLLQSLDLEAVWLLVRNCLICLCVPFAKHPLNLLLTVRGSGAPPVV